MNDYKMIIMTTGSEWKKIIGKMTHEFPEIYEFSDAIILEEVMTAEGIRIMPADLGPKAEGEKFNIKKEFVVVEPFTPSKEVINLYIQITSNLVLP